MYQNDNFFSEEFTIALVYYLANLLFCLSICITLIEMGKGSKRDQFIEEWKWLCKNVFVWNDYHCCLRLYCDSYVLFNVVWNTKTCETSNDWWVGLNKCLI